MPIYVYEIVQADGSEGPRFEIAQGMKEPVLTKHPETGEPVRRVIVPVAIGGSWTESSMNKRMKDDKMATIAAQLNWLEEAGFRSVDCWYKSYNFAVYGGRKENRA